MEQELLSLSATFAEIIARNSIDWVNQKIQIAKNKKDMLSQQNEYEDIINKLLEDKLQLQRITQHYKEAYEGITISDEDIEYLHNTLESALALLLAFSPDQKSNEASLNILINLLNKDTLKTMQLLGFNYKEAIGKPFTEVCSTKILALANPKIQKKPYK